MAVKKTNVIRPLTQIIPWVFGFYTFMLMIRIVGSWFPSFSQHVIMRFLRFYTDPYLNLFRRVIPPIGGMLDLSPLLAFFGLQLSEMILVYILK